jgi:CheY-like chemotaxis protein
MAMSELELSPVVGPTFTGAYRPYLLDVLGRLGLHVTDRVDEAITRGERWLTDELAALDTCSPASLRRGPLEIFQEAMRFPTAALEADKVAPALREAVQKSALPGDIYGLAPASSRDLGESVLAIHIAWGVARAKALTGSSPPGDSKMAIAVVPRAAVAVPDAVVRETIKVALENAGYATTPWRNPAEAETSAGTRAIHVAVLSSAHPVVDDLLEVCTREDIPGIVVCDHPDDFTQARFLTLGAVRVIDHESFVSNAALLLPRIA